MEMDWNDFEKYNMELLIHSDKDTYERINEIEGVESGKGNGGNKIKKGEWDKVISKSTGFLVFNSRLGDFHLRPVSNEKTSKCSQIIEYKLKDIREKLQGKVQGVGWKVDRVHRCRVKEYYQLYKFISITIGNVEYEMMGFRMALDSKNQVVQCCLNELQFGVKIKKQSFSMYPDSLVNGESSSISSKQEYYYNPYIDFYDSADDIAQAFIDFIKKDQENITNANLYIAHKSIADTPILLKLNRETSELEVYQKEEQNPNQVLHNAYSIRDDFDPTDEYAMYVLQKTYPCIFGGEQTPTPVGTFKISKVSDKREEYVSGYHPEYDTVKFFGYMVIFEDYFIHSNMYLSDVTSETFEKQKTISKADEHTSGCIRVPQEAIDWLVENVQEGTTVIM